MEKRIIKQNVGIDVSKDSFHVCFSVMSNAMSLTIKGSRSFNNTIDGIKEFEQWASRKAIPDIALSFTMEATGVYYESLAYYLESKTYAVHVVLPNVAKKYHQSLGLKSKTDKIDAQALAQMGLERKLQTWKPFSGQFRTLKQLTRERESLICERTVALNQLHAYEHQAECIDKTIDRSHKHIAFLSKQIKEIEKEIQQEVDKDRALKQRLSYIESIKGIGLLTAVIVVSETNGFACINSIKQLTSYVGLDVRIAESGKWKGKSKISKRGNRYIRKALYFPAFSKIKHHTHTKDFYDKLAKEKGVKMVAAVAVQRKLLGLMYTLWKKQEMFSDAA